VREAHNDAAAMASSARDVLGGQLEGGFGLYGVNRTNFSMLLRAHEAVYLADFFVIQA
jgi:hypothetical protein